MNKILVIVFGWCSFLCAFQHSSYVRSFISEQKQEVVGEIKGPTAILVHDSSAYVCNLVGKSLSVVDIAKNKVVDIIKHPTMNAPFKIAEINNYGYVCNLNANSISVIDLSTNTFISTLSTQGSGNIAVANINNVPTAFVVDIGVLEVFDLSSPTNPVLIKTYHHPDINGLDIRVSGEGMVYLTGSSSEGQGVLLVGNCKKIKEDFFSMALETPYVKEGRSLNSIAIVGDTYVYVSDQLNNTVLIYDMQKKSYLTSIEGFQSPNALTTIGQCVCVCNFGTYSSWKNTKKKSLETLIGADANISVIDGKEHVVRSVLKGVQCPQAIAEVPWMSDTFYILSVVNPVQCIASDSNGIVSKHVFSSTQVFGQVEPF